MLCLSDRSGNEGEHVLPRWLLKMWPAESGPFTLFRNSEPVLRRDGGIRTQASAVRFKLPVCRACNSELDQRFEKPAKPLIRRIFNAGPPLDPSEVEIVGRWFVKTWLLLAHPQVRASDPGHELTPWQPFQQNLYGWMVSGSEPPAGLSAWATKIDRKAAQATETCHLALPTVVADGSTIEFRVRRFGLAWLDVSLVYHPLWAIDHPLEAQGQAVRLWPPHHTSGLDVGRLPLVRDREMAWLSGPTVHFRPHTHGKVELPALSVSTDFVAELGQTIHMVVW